VVINYPQNYRIENEISAAVITLAAADKLPKIKMFSFYFDFPQTAVFNDMKHNYVL
jgi:hypothetical protein